MKSLRISVSVSEAQKADSALRDTGLDRSFDHPYSDVWVLREADDEVEDEEMALEGLEDLTDEVEDVFNRYRVRNYVVEII